MKINPRARGTLRKGLATASPTTRESFCLEKSCVFARDRLLYKAYAEPRGLADDLFENIVNDILGCQVTGPTLIAARFASAAWDEKDRGSQPNPNPLVPRSFLDTNPA